jgi:hypothetical protein
LRVGCRSAALIETAVAVDGQPGSRSNGLTPYAMTTISKKTLLAPEPPPSVLDRQGIDRLLVMLIAKHHEPRYDIAPQIMAATRATARRVEAAAEMLLVNVTTRRRGSGAVPGATVTPMPHLGALRCGPGTKPSYARLPQYASFDTVGLSDAWEGQGTNG